MALGSFAAETLNGFFCSALVFFDAVFVPGGFSAAAFRTREGGFGIERLVCVLERVD